MADPGGSARGEWATSDSSVAAALTPAPTATDPRRWPIRYSELYRVEAGEVSLLTFDWDGLKARRFRLELDGTSSFDATLTRARDASILASDRRAMHYDWLIPWGKDELAHLTLAAPRGRMVHVTLSLATDPADSNKLAFGFHVNRFLELYGSQRMDEAKAALQRALAEDPQDTVAQVLWRRLWRREGLTTPPMTVSTDEAERLLWASIAEGQRIAAVRRQVDIELAAARPESARARLSAAGSFETRNGRLGYALLEAAVSCAEGHCGAAVVVLHDALADAESVDERFQIYRAMVAANRELGNMAQVRAIGEAALREASSVTLRDEAQTWRDAQ